ncbi:hypothetical protein IV203_000262 [Nitzschia inconspicua]|uniref:Uncharacterized protein n=1 Tax=Nitzschia inconspicua TaxID=303405 RepID=A0A9K3L666_9STRA|nr:hypothetical protein IV203_000262 [Nitzschia inconspicua]
MQQEATRSEDSYNDQRLAELLRSHAPQNRQLITSKTFWIKNNQDVSVHPANVAPSTHPSLSFPLGKLVFEDLCLLGLFAKKLQNAMALGSMSQQYPASPIPTFLIEKFA